MLIIVSGPSGSGKNTVVRRIFQPEQQIRSLSTRPPRDSIDQLEYRFITDAEFLQLQQSDKILESVQHGKYWYGTDKQLITDAVANTKELKVAILDINGLLILNKLFVPILNIIIMPPSWRTLHNRIMKRGRADFNEANQRVRNSRKLYKKSKLLKKLGKNTFLVANFDLENCLQKVHSIINTYLSEIKK